MPIYEYICETGHHIEQIRPYANRDLDVICPDCGTAMRRLPPLPHCMPDGMYSYAPNLGSEEAFVRRNDALRNGQRLIKKDVLTE